MKQTKNCKFTVSQLYLNGLDKVAKAVDEVRDAGTKSWNAPMLRAGRLKSNQERRRLRNGE